MNKKLAEFLILFLVASLILVGASLPTWVGRSLENEDVSFRGQYADNPDYAVDIAMMRAGMQGDWTYQMRFTTEEHRAVSMRLFYIILGHISKWLHLEPEITYGLARWFFGYLAVFAIYFLCKHYFEKKLLVWSSFLLVVFGSGLGWLQLLAGWRIGSITPIDFWLIDAYVFFSLSLFPHFSCTIALMALGALFYLKFLQTGNWSWVLLVALAAILTQMVNPIAFVVVDGFILFSTMLACVQAREKAKQRFTGMVIIALSQLPLLIYNIVILGSDPIWSQYTAQNITLSPSPLHYLFGFGLMCPLVIIGVWKSVQQKNARLLGLAGWLLTGFILAYLPTLIQRRFLIAVTLPLGILSVVGLEALLEWVNRKRKVEKPLAYLVTIFLVSISSVYLIFGNIQVLKTLPDTAFYPAELDGAFDWLKQNGQPGDFVLSAESTGQLIAQKTGLKVYLGHEMETIGYTGKKAEVAQAYQENLSVEVLSSIPMDWVIYGPDEQQLAPNFVPGENLIEVYDSSGVRIFAVK